MTGLVLELVLVYETMVVSCACAAVAVGEGVGGAGPPPPARLSLTSLLEATLPIVRPMVAAGSNRCENLKSMFGLTYEQMLEKNSTNIHDTLNIDLITKNGNVKYNLTATKKLNRLMNNASDVIILIHGFMESSDGLMVQGLSPYLLKQPGWTILALDGRKIINLEYFRSTTYVRFMGEKLGTLLSDIITMGQNPAKLTLVGHSLGAHAAGAAGRRVRRSTGTSIHRIVALDPAGPCFTSVGAAPARLQQDDAAYVDVIHTNAGVLGYSDPVGHKDFYPNGGISQPGCYFSTCDHTRAWELFAETITAPDRFPARKCGNWTMFKDGLCSNNEVVFMGMKSEPGSPGTYFLATGPSAPFGLGPAGSG